MAAGFHLIQCFDSIRLIHLWKFLMCNLNQLGKNMDLMYLLAELQQEFQKFCINFSGSELRCSVEISTMSDQYLHELTLLY